MGDIITVEDEFSRLAADILRAGNSLKFRARGRSMRPFISDGDVLTVDPVRAIELRIGDIVFYCGPGHKLTAHRLLTVRETDGEKLFLIRGDGLSGKYEEVKEEQVLGIVTRFARRGRERSVRGSFSVYPALLWARLQPMGVIFYRIGGIVKRLFASFLLSFVG